MDSRLEVDMLRGRKYLKRFPRELALAVFSLFSRLEKGSINTFKRVAGREWFILRDIFGGSIEETAYVLASIFFYPVGLIDWDRGLLASLLNNGDDDDKDESRNGRRPVLLLHGYFHNNSAYLLLRDRLKKDGWSHVYTFNLATHREDIQTMSKRVAAEANRIMKKTKQTHIDIIGHSLGGLVARYYVQRLDGYKKVVNCITMGTPHKGTELAIIGFGTSAKQMSPRGAFLNDLNSDISTLKKVWFTSIWSPFDIMVLPPENAVLHDGMVKNVRVNFVGHMGMLFSDRVYRVIKHTLQRKEKRSFLSLIPFSRPRPAA